MEIQRRKEPENYGIAKPTKTKGAVSIAKTQRKSLRKSNHKYTDPANLISLSEEDFPNVVANNNELMYIQEEEEYMVSSHHYYNDPYIILILTKLSQTTNEGPDLAVESSCH